MSLASNGYRMPAEWARQEAVWLSWPHNRETWPDNFGPIPAKFAEIAAAISRYEGVRINCPTPLRAEAFRLLREADAVLDRVEIYNHATNDTWCRDHGPIFVKHRETGRVMLTDWLYNAWGGKYPPYDLDNAIPSKIAAALGIERHAIPVVLEGGSIDVNGAGVLMTSEACLLNKNRNPSLSREEIEEYLRDNLGVDTFLWLGDGIVGDDTDGHVDDLARFFREDAIVTVVEDDKDDVNYAILQDNLERLKSFRTSEGKPYEIRTLPMPRPCFYNEQQMPASYANFLIINGAVLMPIFRQSDRDEAAAEVLEGCFPGREIIPIDCVELVWGLGTLHCISQQQPA